MPSKSKDAIFTIQHALARRGFDPGTIDGIWGRRTESAVRAFQQAKGLLVDGIVGPVTWQALIGAELANDSASNPGIPWFQEAQRLIGLQEDPGPGSNPDVIELAARPGIAYRDDEVPWCGLFVAHCISSTLGRETLPADPLGARQWRKFGVPCPPTIGAIIVFWREDRDSYKGHVGFYAGEEADGKYLILGGNQGNAVCIRKYDQAQFLDSRWPATAPFVDSGRPTMAASDTLLATHHG